MTISILGCGWYGQALAKHLISKGYTVKGSTRTDGKLDDIDGILPYVVDVHQDIDPGFLECDVLIVACGSDIGRLPVCDVNRVIYISTTGVYRNGIVDEHSPVDPSKPHYIAEQQLARHGLSVIRFGGLVGPGRMPGRFLAGKKDMPNGDAPVNLIHLDDCIGLTEAMIHDPLPIVNGVSPDHPSRKVFYRLAAEEMGLVLPEFNEVELDTKLVITAFQQFYRYQIIDWMDWLRDR